MRAILCLTLLALAACDENTGWNPNYVLSDRPYGDFGDSHTPYAAYKVAREKALLGRGEVPKTVPLARPFQAPTPAQIAGPNLYQIITREAIAVVAEAEGKKAPRTALVISPPTPVFKPAKAAPRRAVVATAAVPAATAGATATAGGYVAPSGPASTATLQATLGPYPGATPVLVKYALTATHAPGTAVWQRPGADPAAALRACRSYADADAAQVAFLAAGGPAADPRRMDPDGDGFVCGWNPAPWRQAAAL